MRVLVGCESSGVVRDAFIRAGHDAVSCDLKPTEVPGPHIQRSVLTQLGGGWDLAVFHPPCTYLSRVSAPRLARDPSRMGQLQLAADFFRSLLLSPIPMVAVENPVMLRVAQRRIGVPATQFVDPTEFGHPYTKKTGLWLRNLPHLVPTSVVPALGSWVEVTRCQTARSRTFVGVADAMASQWPGVAGSPVPLFDAGLVT